MVSMRPILLVIGMLLSILAVAMLIPAFADFYVGRENWQAFLYSAFFTAFFGVALFLTNRSKKAVDLTIKQAFLLTTLTWLTTVCFAALPFFLSDEQMDITNSFFEAMSGLTTTGATVMTELDRSSPGILLWRSLLQWLGGIGIIVMAMAVLPMLKIGGMQLFRTESSDNAEKALPRARQIAGAISGFYLAMTMMATVSLWAAGMKWFDALCHAMTTVAIGGFSTHDASIGYYDSAAIEAVMCVFMVASGIPFILYIQMLRGRTRPLFTDSQVRWFLFFLAGSITIVTFWLMQEFNISFERAFRMAAFNVISVGTTAGFVTHDYYAWGSFVVIFIFLLCVVGGCTGSACGGMKIFRLQVLFATARIQVNQLVQPHGVFKPLYNGKPISDQATSSVMGFIILFGSCFAVLATLLAATGLDYITSMSAAASMLANLGPGLGDIIGPAGNYETLSEAAKWLCAVGMLIGRLELYTVLILFSPYFWKS